MAYQINYAYISHIGKVRGNNEDNFWCCGDFLPARNKGTRGVRSGRKKVESYPVLGVFDGMGGESCGETAAFLAAETCGKWYGRHRIDLVNCPEHYLAAACIEMNHAVCSYAEENRIRTMGSTAAMLAFNEQGVYACNLGDSRIFEMQNRQFQQISLDHVLQGNIFGKAPLTQFVGIPEDSMTLEPTIVSLELRLGNRYLICSDGVTDMIEEKELQELVSKDEKVEKIAEEICELALERGGKDNTTLIVCEVAEKANVFSRLFYKLRKASEKGEE